MSQGVRNNVFSTHSSACLVRSPAPLNYCSSDEKENACLKFVKSKGRDQSNPPLKFNNSQFKQSPQSKQNFITHSHKKLEKTFTNIDENLNIMVQDHNLLQNTLQKQEIEAQDQVQRLVHVYEQLNVFQLREIQLKGDKDELFKKIKILLSENEKSTNLIELLAQVEEQQRVEFEQLQDAYQQSLQHNEELLQNHQTEINEFEQQSIQNDYIVQEMDDKINRLNQENYKLLEQTEQQFPKNTQVLEEHISELIEENEDISNQLLTKQMELQCYQDLEGRVDEVIQQNQEYKVINNKLLEQLKILENNNPNNDDTQLTEKDKLIQTLQQKLKNTEIKLGVMSDDNVRLNKIMCSTKKLNI